MNPIDYAEKIRKILHLSMKDLYGKSREQPLAFKRQVAMYLTLKNTGATLKNVGWAFNRHHTNIMWARKVITGRMETCERDRRYVDNLEHCMAVL